MNGRTNGKLFRQRLANAVAAAARDVEEMAEDIAGGSGLITGLEIRIRMDCSVERITPVIEIIRTHYSRTAFNEIVKHPKIEG